MPEAAGAGEGTRVAPAAAAPDVAATGELGAEVWLVSLESVLRLNDEEWEETSADGEPGPPPGQAPPAEKRSASRVKPTDWQGEWRMRFIHRAAAAVTGSEWAMKWAGGGGSICR